MKPLELTVYPKPRYSLTTWQYQTDPSKRLTGPELAAETWHSITKYYALCPSPEAVEEARRNRVIERFATHDHYDQEDQ